ncbi:MAG: phenylalanine--tRNA ligase subunit beta [Chloroflexota bacterium]|nr:phenylalanine--tRNA ligase subunit beta [Chloroflexota bacterium]
MRVPLSWLRDYVDFDLQPEGLALRLAELGMEVQGIERVGSDWRSIVVGELLEVAPHPGADSLLLTRVRVADDGEPLSIVCGATNIAPGQRVPVALPGAVLPGGRTIGVSRIQGADSQGMLCSGDELRLTSDAEGILILAEDGRDGPAVGQPLEAIVGDVVLDVDVKPNRGDALSLIGLAREVVAITGGRLRWPDVSVPESGDATADHISVEVEDTALCSRFVGRHVDELTVGPSPLAVQLRLSSAGMRPVSNVVDASNYVMLEMGKPIHTFDAASVAEGRIIVRRARSGERLETLDHVQRELTTDTLLIADPRGPLGIAGVMGGAVSEVGPTTSAVIIESAVFDPVSIRRTAQRYGLRSEASARFEKGQESRLALLGANRTAQLIAAWAGGRPARGVVDTNPVVEPARRVTFRPARVSRLLGEEIGASEMQELLARIEIGSEPADATDEVTIIEGQPPVPAMEHGDQALVALVLPHRRDLVIEADISEEIARLYGYERLPARLPDTEMPGYRQPPHPLRNRLRVLLAGRGLSEVVTNALIGPEDHLRLGFAADDESTVRVANPIALDHSELRRSLLPGLVRVLVTNERQRRDDVAIFEIGPIHRAIDGRPSEREQLGILLAGRWLPQSWAEPAREAGVERVKGLLEALAARLGVAELHYRPFTPWPLVEHPGRSAAVYADRAGEPVELGRVGELDPRYLAANDARATCVAFALVDADKLTELHGGVVQVVQLPRLPSVERDLAVVVPRDLPQLRVAELIRAEAGPLLDSLLLFDRYHGPPLDPSEISLAYRLRFQPRERTLAETELQETMERIAQRLWERLGARIRSGESTDG